MQPSTRLKSTYLGTTSYLSPLGLGLLSVLAMQTAALANATQINAVWVPPAQIQQAQNDTKSIRIPAGDLKASLDLYIQQTGTQLIFRLDDLRGRSSKGLDGRYTRHEALQQLIAQSEPALPRLTIHSDPSGAYSLVMAKSTAAAPIPAQASAPIEMSFEEVTVTARRVEEGLQKVPVAITALSSEEIEKKRIISALDLKESVPGVYVAPFQNADQMILAIRGQRTSQSQPGQDQAISLYVNDVPAAYPYGLNLGFFDLADIQVLKGPQGTLFGRNTTGGAILLNTRKPTDQFEGYVRAGYESFYSGSGFTTTSAVNLPITDGLNLRVALDTVNRDGYLQNVAPQAVVDAANITTGPYAWRYGKTDYKDLGEQDSVAWRISLDWSPTSRINNFFMYQGVNVQGTDTPPHLFGAYTNSPAPAPLASGAFNLGITYAAPYVSITRDHPNFWSVMSAVQLPFELDQHQFINTTTVNLSPNLAVKNIASYKLTHRLAARELVGLPGYFTNVEFPSTNREFSEELQLQGAAFDDQLSWVAGIFYMQTHIDTASPGMYFGYSTRVVTAHSQTAAVFAQGTYNLPWVDGLALTLGARYTADDRKLTTSAFRGSATTCSLRVGGIAPTPCTATDKKNFGQWTYNATLNYQVDPDTLVYAIHSRGYRAGGLNGADPNFETFTIGYKPETNKNYEIGLKRDWDIGFPLRTNLAGYIQKYTNVVRQLYPQSTTGNTVQLLINGPEADILGTEVEVRARPIDDLELNLSYSYVNAHYTADWQPVLGLQGRDLRFSLVPATQFNMSATYTLPIINPEHGEVSFTAHISHQSRMWGDDVQQPPYYPAVGTIDDLSQKPYSLVNLRVDWKSVMGSNFDLNVWVKNLTNTKYYTAFNPSATSGMLAGYNGLPRFVGFDVKYRFGAAAD